MGGGGWGGPMSLSKGRKTHAHLLRRTCFSNHPGDGVHTAKSPAANGLIFVDGTGTGTAGGGKTRSSGHLAGCIPSWIRRKTSPNSVADSET